MASQASSAEDALAALDLHEAAALLQRGDLAAEDYAHALLTRCQRWSGLNAFISQDADATLQAARAADRRRRQGGALGRLHGVPLIFKDNIDVAGWPTSGGTKALAAYRPKNSALVTDRLLRQQAIVLGKTNMHELAMGWTGRNPHFGQTANPLAPGRIAGGSSGGTAAAVAAGLAPGGLGTDTNGLIRVPSAFCGIWGFRPTPGRYPMQGIMLLAPSLDTVGPMARCVADIVLLDSILSNRPAVTRRIWIMPSENSGLRHCCTRP